MANKTDLIKRVSFALKASQPGLGAGMGMLPYQPGAGGMSPVVTAYHEWSSGSKYGSPLPRPLEDFITGAFGPSAPIVPFAIDEPDDDSGRPAPRRWQYPLSTNLPHLPGSTKMVQFATLREYAEKYSVARTCVQVRKAEVVGLDWDIVPTSEKSEAIGTDKAALKEFKARRDEALEFWKRPDSNYLNFKSWLFALLEEIFVPDALALYLHPTRVAGKGPFGSSIAALDLLDGSMVYPLVDVTGATPRPPAPAYQLYLQGVPRVDLTTIILESDADRLKEFGPPADEYRGDQLLYAPYNRRA